MGLKKIIQLKKSLQIKLFLKLTPSSAVELTRLYLDRGCIRAALLVSLKSCDSPLLRVNFVFSSFQLKHVSRHYFTIPLRIKCRFITSTVFSLLPSPFT